MSQIGTQQNFGLRASTGPKTNAVGGAGTATAQSGAAFNRVLDHALATKTNPKPSGQPGKLPGDQGTPASNIADLSGTEDTGGMPSPEGTGSEHNAETSDSQELGDSGSEQGNPVATEQQLVNYSHLALTQLGHVAGNAAVPGTETADSGPTVQGSAEAVRAAATVGETIRPTAVASDPKVAAESKATAEATGLTGAQREPAQKESAQTQPAQTQPAQTQPATANPAKASAHGAEYVTGGAQRTEASTIYPGEQGVVLQVPAARNHNSESPPAQHVVPGIGVVASPVPVAPATLPAVPAPQQAPDMGQHMANQMRGPLGQLRTAAPGEHVFTISITPENMGPVHVRAHIGAEGVRVELVGATDAVRDQLRTILTDLRRDLQSTGLNAQLGVAQSSSNSGERGGQDNLTGEFRSFKDQQSSSGNPRSPLGPQERETVPGLDQDLQTPTHLSTLGAPRVDILA